MGCVVEQGLPSFVFLILQQLDLGNLCKPGPVPAISEGEVREIRVALPPEPEQEQIVQWVAAKTSDLDRATGIVSHECSLVREFHSRLIADVVTGKLDVRAAAAVLPDELDEPEVIEGEVAEEYSDEAGPTEVEEETEAA
jgi:type I restriction enzyme S subunit